MADFLSQLKSTTQSVADKLQSFDINQKIKSGVTGVVDAVRSDLTKGGYIGTQTSFPRVDVAPVSRSVGGKSPEETYTNNARFQGALIYPSEVKYYAMFTFSAYERLNLGTNNKKLPTVSIVLPMPSNLEESFRVGYDTPALGPLVGTAADKLRDMMGGGGSQTNGETSIVSTAQQVASLGIQKAVSGVSESLEGALRRATGITPNPHLATIFRNVELRSHSFSYVLTPASESELRRVKEIVKQLRTRMLPAMTQGSDIQFIFPDQCDITFGPNKTTPYKIKRCVLETLNVKYAPSGSPAFFKTGDPVEVHIEMSFKEMDAFTREDMEGI
jgi:Tail-tube assembly protein